MDRRAILRYTAYATGLAITAPFATAFLTSCQQEATSADVATSFFSDKEMNLLKSVIDTILPKTDSPSATEVGVHTMIESMIHQVYDEEAQQQFREGFEQLKTFLASKDFENATAESQTALLQSLETDETEQVVKDAYHGLKQQTIAYYLSTETIGTKFLNYLPVPGEYDPCMPLADVGGKRWAL